MKRISKSGMDQLREKGILKNTNRGHFNKRGEYVSIYITCGGKVYIEDKYADMVM